MAVLQRNWRPVALISACSLLAALGFVLAQEPPGVVPKPVQPAETPAAALELAKRVNAEKSSADQGPLSPRLSAAQQDIGSIRRSYDLYAGSVLAGDQKPEQEQEAINRAIAASEAAEETLLPAVSPPLPVPIEIADEVVLVTAQLRALARSLDQIAANDEDAADFSRADSLRRAALRIRREARDLGVRRSPAPAQLPKAR